MDKQDFNPLTAPVPPEIPLINAPLLRVISQIRFPIIVSIEKQDFIGAFQESIRGVYPILRPEQSQNIIMGPRGVETARSQTTWRFSDTDEKWKVSLAPQFLALETTSYTSRIDFMERLRIILNALNTYISPKIIDRLGIRYIDRVTGNQLKDIRKLVRKEMLGILSTTLADNAQQILSESALTLPDGKTGITIRWGRLPEKATIDPGAIEPISEPSWILDIDMFSTQRNQLNPNQLVEDARGYSERIYAFFRWVVEDEFLRQYGGNI
jgi:uncharacterized protein (TIGR04255 family)